MSDDEGREDLAAAFVALGGSLAPDELARLRALPVRQREAVVLCDYLGLTVEQAAARLRITVGALRSHLARGR